MKVFHGSYTAIEAVDLSKCQDNKDFGRVFYQLTKYPKPSHQICFCTVNSLRMLNPENQKIIYKIENISEPIIEQLFLDLDYNEEQAADLFFSSTTFGQLAEKDTELYLKPWQEIYEMLKTELKLKKVYTHEKSFLKVSPSLGIVHL